MDLRELALHCVFTGCNGRLGLDADNNVLHLDPPPDGVAKHVPHYEFDGVRYIDLTELDERDGGGA